MKAIAIIGGIVIVVAILSVGAVYSLKSKNTVLAPVVSAPSLESFVNATLVENRDAPLATSSEIEQKKSEQKKNIVSSLSERCQGTQWGVFDCYEKYFKEIVEKKGIKDAFVELRNVYPQNAYVRSQCHPLTHVIGNSAALKFANVSEAYAQGDSFCWSGYYHGVLEGVIARIGYDNLVNQMNSICADVAAKKRYSFDHYNCVHGLGHGVMAITNDELFQSLSICDSGLTDSWDQQSCYSGAFMENIIIDGKNHVTKYLKPEEPLYPCSAVDDRYKTTCFLMQTSYMLKVTGNDFIKVFALCRQVTEPYNSICLQSLGRDASGQSISNVEKTKATCMLGETIEEQKHCIIGAVKDFISYFHDDVEAKKLCASLMPELQNICNATAQSYYSIL